MNNNCKITFIFKRNINNLDLQDYSWINQKYIHKSNVKIIIIFHLNLQYQKQVSK